MRVAGARDQTQSADAVSIENMGIKMDRQETIKGLAKAITKAQEKLTALHADLDRELTEAKEEKKTAAEIARWAGLHRVSVHEAIKRHQKRI
jgi:hypothetical protein